MPAFLRDFPGIIPFKYSNPELSLAVSFIKKAVALLGINVLPRGSVRLPAALAGEEHPEREATVRNSLRTTYLLPS